MTDQERVEALRSALQRVLRVMEWAPLCKLFNVRADMAEAKREIESVINSYPPQRKLP